MKKFLTICAVFCMVCALFVGCVKEEVPEHRTMVYRQAFEHLSDGELERSKIGNAMKTEKGYRYAYGYDYRDDDGEYRAGIVLVESDADGNITKEMPLTEYGNNGGDTIVLGERGIYVIGLYYDEAAEDNFRRLFRFSYDGQCEAFADIPTLRGKGGVNDYPKIGRYILETEDGIILIWDRDCIVADDTFTRVSEFKLPGDVYAAFMIDGELWAEYSEDGRLKFGCFADDGMLTESYVLPGMFEKAPTDYAPARILGYEDGYLYAYDNTGVFRWKVTAEEEQEPVFDTIMNFVDSGISGEYLQVLTWFPGEYDGEFMAAERKAMHNIDCDMRLYRPDPTIDLSAMETLTLACVTPESDLTKAVVDFNKSRTDVRIEVLDYSRYNTEDEWSAGQDRLMLDLTTGILEPDILFVNTNSYTELSEIPGYFNDLYTLMDGEVTPETIYGSVKNTLEAENGELYGVAAEFFLNTLIGRRDTLGDRTKWTLTEFLDFYDALGEGEYLMEEVAGEDADYQFFSFMAYAPFIRDGKADFLNPEFTRLLEFMKSLPTEPQLYMDHGSNNLAAMYAGEITPDQVEIVEGGENLYHNGKIKLDKYQTIQSPQNILRAAYTFGVKSPAELNCIGYPVDDRCTSGVEVIISGGVYTIPSCSSNAETAWEFIESRLTAETYLEYAENSSSGEVSYGYFFKAYKPDYDAYLDALEGYQALNLQNGSRLAGFDLASELDAEGRYKGQQGILCVFDRAAVEAMKQLLDTAGIPLYYDNRGGRIPEEEVSRYLSGNATAESTADAIQSRVSIWLSEHE